ncbi:MAG: DUF4976 domain-containing protein [Anaerolineales bacterium]|nr:DUF4976 domain-containing protein [Anaerolineales bacterium]
MASILALLELAALDQDTIIIFTSDNGLTMGEHRFGFSKNCPYEECITLPFIIHGSGYFPAGEIDKVVANIDIAPTIAELAGIPIPEGVDGLSMVPILENAAAPWREEHLLEHWPTEEGIGMLIPGFYGIRTDQWKYIEYETGEKELYDLVYDPYEMQNLAGKYQYKVIQVEMSKRLAELKDK